MLSKSDLKQGWNNLRLLTWDDWRRAAAGEGPTLEEVEAELPGPPKWLRRAANRFRMGFALAVLVSMALTLVGCSAQAQDGNWRPVSQVLPDPIIQELIEAETSVTGSEADDLAETLVGWSIPGDEGRLVLVDYRSDLLCGSSGCLYSGLWLDGDELQGEGVVFSAYLRPDLPPEIPLIHPIEVDDGVARPLPCLQASQVEDHQVVERISCLRDGRYQGTRNRRLPLAAS
ncbi:hypothetical protein [Phormidium sp. FACHB-1136]|uniref:hypothetical protein n=1 Tax=Phormidium sp. FACHB-1136 TaxID=2692848 RepID=UPI0016881453|nr:hypothetical protein [Phormidium sp. FACHB-1136]MBD2429358.1 hypothetical protein [Phormidium sp. FACHB-1136]